MGRYQVNRALKQNRWRIGAAELPLPSSAAFDHSQTTCWPSTANDASNLGEVAGGMTMNSTTSDSASLIRRTPMLSANGLVERG
jgi:hypothetical protein